MAEKPDPFAQFKTVQREMWSSFAPMEIYTTIPAAKLVGFAGLKPQQRVLDVACGTGVVAVTAARAGAKVTALDLTPALLERARHNADLAQVEIEFIEGDAEALPFPAATFDVVLSQFGHMFAPRPEVVTAELLRVLKPGGRLAFSTWPPDLFVGRQFAMLAHYQPTPPAGAPVPVPAAQWGDPNVVRQRLGDAVSELRFEPAVMIVPGLSPRHVRTIWESAVGPLTRTLQALADQPGKVAQLRAEVDALIGEYFEDNQLRQHFLMSRATKK